MVQYIAASSAQQMSGLPVSFGEAPGSFVVLVVLGLVLLAFWKQVFMLAGAVVFAMVAFGVLEAYAAVRQQ